MENQAFEGKEKDDNSTAGDNIATGDKASMKEKEASTLSMPVDTTRPDKPYSGMGKEDLLRFSDTPFWNRLRIISLLIFWLFWVSLLVAVVVLTITAPRCKEAPTREWWQKTTFYQIYVRSFYDSEGNDGVGDINGVTEKLDYIQGLNVEAIVLSSFYPSGSGGVHDYGYEVTDHVAIQSEYGDMVDFEALLMKAHERGMKVIIDFIPNHTGLDHPWFGEWIAQDPGKETFYTSAASCATANDPNNWVSLYGGRAWSVDAGSGTCYLHQLLDTQPELNLRSQQVKDELAAILRFWLDKGVDGFRVIGAKYLVEDFDMRDDNQLAGCNDANAYECFDHIHTATQPENIDLISQWRGIVNSYSTPEQIRVLLSDANENVNNTIKYYAMGEIDGANLPLNYQVVQDLNSNCGGNCVYDLVKEWVDNAPEYATMDWMTGHQDVPRITRPTGSNFAFALNILRMMLPGSSIVYYGEEIGMTSGDAGSWPGGCTDPGFTNSSTPCRDESRTPMQWDGSTDAGFTNDSSWLPVNDDYLTVNVDVQESDDTSVLQVFRKLAELRNTSTALHYGDIHFSVHNDEVFSFVREYDGTDRYFVSINFGTQASTTDYTDDLIPGSAEVVVSSGQFVTGDQVDLKQLELQPGEAVVCVWAYSRP